MILAVIMAFTLCACGKNKTKNNSEFVGMQNIQSMVDYAEKLERRAIPKLPHGFGRALQMPLRRQAVPMRKK